MGNQRTFASMAWNGKGKVTRRERFLAEMDAVIPWPRLVRLIEPHYPKAGQGRQPLGLEKMLRIYFLQQWFNLSDPQAEDAIYDSESMRRFARVELGDEVVPDESTILRFRHLLEQHGLTHGIFDAVADLLEARRLLLRSGTIVDAPRFSAGSTNSFPSPAVAPSATRRFVSAGRAAQSRPCSRGSGSTFTPRHPRSANAAVTESNTGSPAPTSTQKPVRSSGRRARASTTSSWFCAYDTNGSRLTGRLRQRSGWDTVR